MLMCQGEGAIRDGSLDAPPTLHKHAAAILDEHNYGSVNSLAVATIGRTRSWSRRGGGGGLALLT